MAKLGVPGVRFEETSALDPAGALPSFVTGWPLRPCSRSLIGQPSYFANKFFGLLECLVAGGDWHGWLVFSAGERSARNVLGASEWRCAECGRLDMAYPGASHCRKHQPQAARRVGPPDFDCPWWVIVWQTRAASQPQSQRAELRRLWNSCRWCPDGADDYEPMFEASTLAVAMDLLRPLDALACLRLGLTTQGEGDTAPADTPASAGEGFALPPQLEERLSLRDIAAPTFTARGAPVRGPGPPPPAAARIASRYDALLAAFPHFAELSLEALENASVLFGAVSKSEHFGGSGVLASWLRGVWAPDVDAMAVDLDDEEGRCVHSCWELDAVYLETCACGRPAAAVCRFCRLLLCTDCASQWPLIENLALTGEEGSGEGSTAATFLCPSDDVRAEGQKVLCSACVEAPAMASALVSERFSALCFCAPCATVVHNTVALVEAVRQSSAEVASLTTLGAGATPSGAQVPTPKAAEAHALALASPEPGGRPLPTASSSTLGLPLVGGLIPPTLESFVVRRKKISGGKADKAWLAELVYERTRAARILPERLRRLAAVERTSALRGGCVRPPKEPACAELPRLLLDILRVYRLQGAWREHKGPLPALDDVICRALESLLPEQNPSEPTGWLPACTKRLCAAFQADPLDGGARPSLTRLFAAWRTAPAGAPSQLDAAFPSGTRPVAVEVPICLNPKCLGPVLKGGMLFTDPKTDPAAAAPLTLTRCSLCNFPRSFGRTVFSIQDVLRPSLERERGSLLRASFLCRDGRRSRDEKVKTHGPPSA